MDTKPCRHCGEELEQITILVHHRIMHLLEWLVENRKFIADEQSSGEVLERLIQLEYNKRFQIEEDKEKTRKSREEARQKKGKP